ncbi:tetratricopeptide repeat protein [Persephonella atlantica]|uniref:Tetratricopeptide repeat protein n=1 Tax=Persephonella atlantica TaxID=2699429 RepID=A0ABS1GJA2_9AQUI|nr:tetratricopeptide repeat protein [Persephonella atlantica]MBK3333009.1 tetratricopeptide repeat protein [Persephonella atlantica]
MRGYFFIPAIFVMALFLAGCQQASRETATIKKIQDEQLWGRKNRAKKAVRIYKKTADEYYKEKAYDKAIVFYNKALVKLKYLKKLKHPYAAQIYEKMGDCYLKLNDRNIAEEFYKKAVEIYQKFYGSEDIRVKRLKEKIKNISLSFRSGSGQYNRMLHETT